MLGVREGGREERWGGWCLRALEICEVRTRQKCKALFCSVWGTMDGECK